jgi:hypothetical protein
MAPKQGPVPANAPIDLVLRRTGGRSRLSDTLVRRRRGRLDVGMHLHVASFDFGLSSPLWIPISVLLAGVVGALLIWLTWKLVFDRKRLYYSIFTAPLVNSSIEVTEQLRIYYGRDTDPIRDPWVVQIRLSSHSAKDISEGDFSRKAPLVIEFDAPVIAILYDSNTESSKPIIDYADTEVRMHPGLIRGKSARMIDVLIAGEPSVSITERPIINCTVVERGSIYSRRESFGREQWLIVIFSVLATLALLIIASLIFYIINNNSEHQNPGPSVSVYVPPSGAGGVPGVPGLVPSSGASHVKSSSSP